MAYPDLAALKAAIDAEPANAARSDEDVAAWLIEEVSHINTISTKKLMGWAATDDILRNLDTAADDSGQSNTMRGIARGMAAIMRGREELDIGDAETQQLLGVAVSGGLITQAHRDDLEARATMTLARWNAEGLPSRPRTADVTAARAL